MATVPAGKPPLETDALLAPAGPSRFSLACDDETDGSRGGLPGSCCGDPAARSCSFAWLLAGIADPFDSSQSETGTDFLISDEHQLTVS